MTGLNERVDSMPHRKTPEGEISRRLKSFYESVQEEEIPDKFLNLLEKLDEAERASGVKGRSGQDNGPENGND